MTETPKHIKFQNRQHPADRFDMLSLEDLYTREAPDHDPEHLHRVDFYLMILFTGGKGGHTIDFTDYNCERGTLVTIRKDQLHRFVKNKSVTGFLLLFTDEFLVSYLEKLEAHKSMQLFNELLGEPILRLTEQETQEACQLIQRIQHEYMQVHDDYSMGIIRSELHILIAKLYRVKSQCNQVITERKYLSEFISLQQLVEQHATQTTRVQDYAKMMGYSTKTLNAITKSIVNKTAKEFVDEICTKQIKRLLINTQLSVKEIAYTSGFEETTNFYKYFKRQTRTTPEQFRESF